MIIAMLVQLKTDKTFQRASDDHNYENNINTAFAIADDKDTAVAITDNDTAADDLANLNCEKCDGVIQKLKNSVKALRLKVITFKKRIRQFKQQEQSLSKLLKPDQLQSMKRKSAKGMKWSGATVKRALKICFACGSSGYESLMDDGMPFPSARTLRRRMQTIPFDSGILEKIFQYMKVKVQGMNSHEIKCVLTVDEMSITPHIDYDKQAGQMVGEVTIPGHSGKATHALVFMLAGLSTRWKQTVAYYFTGNSTNGECIKPIILQIIEQAKSIGLEVVTITSDMGPVNRAWWREFGIGCGRGYSCYRIAHPFIDKSHLYFMADVPHLIKNLKGALVRGQDVVFSDETVRRHDLMSNTMNLKPIHHLLEYMEGKDLLLTPKLKKFMLRPSHFQQMKVSAALNLFSSSVSAGLRFMIEDLSLVGKQQDDYETAAWFISICNRWFDLMSSRSPVTALSRVKPEEYDKAKSFLKDFIAIIAGCRIGGNTWKPVQSGMIMSTEAVLDLADELLDDKSFLLTSRLTQDCLESLFSCVRFKNPVPTPKEFKNALKMISVAQFLKEVKNTSYQYDDNQYLAEFLDNTENSCSVQQELEAGNDVLICDLQENMELKMDEQASLYYVIGYCLRALKNEKQLCDECYASACTDLVEHSYQTLNVLKDYKPGALCYPSADVFEQVKTWESIFQQCQPYALSSKNIRQQIVDNCLRHSHLEGRNCHSLTRKLMLKFVDTRLHFLSRKFNAEQSNNSSHLGSKSTAMRELAKRV